MIKVSIIIPVYNVAPYLDATFGSLLAQTLHDIEVIAVDDGSTDGSSEIIERYAAGDSRITCLHQQNGGASVARNRGMELATGEYVYFMDADDVISPDALELAYNRARTMDAEICLFDAEIMYEEGAAPLSWDYRQTRLLDEDRLYDGAGLLNLMMDHHRYNSVVWLYIIRTSFFRRAGVRFRAGIIHEDELFTTLLFLRSNRICGLRRTLVSHRVRRTSVMGHGFTRRNLSCYLTVMDELRPFLSNATVERYMRFTLPIVFHAGHVMPLRDKPALFLRALRSGYLRYVGLRSMLVFWLKRKR